VQLLPPQLSSSLLVVLAFSPLQCVASQPTQPVVLPPELLSSLAQPLAVLACELPQPCAPPPVQPFWLQPPLDELWHERQQQP